MGKRKDKKPIDPKDRREYHWFVSSALNWHAGNSLTETLAKQRKADRSDKAVRTHGCNIFRVTGDCRDTNYPIRNYRPPEDISEFVGAERY